MDFWNEEIQNKCFMLQLVIKSVVLIWARTAIRSRHFLTMNVHYSQHTVLCCCIVIIRKTNKNLFEFRISFSALKNYPNFNIRLMFI